MATNKDASAQDRSTPKETPRCGLCGKTDHLNKTECCGSNGDPITAAEDLLRIAEDPSLSLRERFRQVDQAADRLLAAFPGPRKKPEKEEPGEEIDDEAYDAMSEESAKEYIESLVIQAKDTIEIGLDKIAEGLSVPTGVLPKEAIRQAQKHSELMIPRLIRILEETAAVAAEMDSSRNNAHFFALHLLAESGAEEAFPAIRKVLSLPDGLPYRLFGDAVTEHLPEILAPFTWDCPDVLEEMIADLSISETVRYGAASTIASLVAANRLSWEEGVRTLGRQVARDVEENDAQTFDFFSDVLCQVLPRKVIYRIDNAISHEESDQTARIMEIIEEAVADPKVRRDSGSTCPEGLPVVEDTLDELRDWYCFRENAEDELLDDEENGAWMESIRERKSDSPRAPHFLEDREETAPVLRPIASETPAIGRGRPCPCGSGKEYAKCCGAKK